MVGLVPYPSESSLKTREWAAYDQPCFAMKSLPPGGPELAKEEEKRRKRQQTLRLMVQYDVDGQSPQLGPAEAVRVRDELVPAAKGSLATQAKAANLNAIVLDEREDLPDVVIAVCRRDGRLQARVYGDEQDLAKRQGMDPTYVGDSITEVVQNAMEDYIEAHALALLLFRLHEDAEATLSAPCSLAIESRLGKSVLAPNDAFDFVGSGPQGAVALVMDQDLIDGRVQLIFPYARDGRVTDAGYSFFSKAGGRQSMHVDPATENGEVCNRALFVTPGATEPLPTLPPGATNAELIRYLHALIAGIQDKNKTYLWKTCEATYTVRKTSD
jgi:hypothetical protein